MLCGVRVEGMFPWMRVFRCAIWHYHLRQRQSVEERADLAIVVIRDSRDCDPLSEVECCTLRTQCHERGMYIANAHAPMCIFHFCHSSSCPSILKLTPSGWTTCNGLTSSRVLNSLPGFCAIKSGKKSQASRGGGMRERCAASNESSLKDGGTVEGAERALSIPCSFHSEDEDGWER